MIDLPSLSSFLFPHLPIPFPLFLFSSFQMKERKKRRKRRKKKREKMKEKKKEKGSIQAE